MHYQNDNIQLLIIEPKTKDLWHMPSRKADSRDKILNEFLAFTLTKCMDTLGARSGSIFLLVRKKEQLVLKTALNGQNRNLAGIRQPFPAIRMHNVNRSSIADIMNSS